MNGARIVNDDGVVKERHITLADVDLIRPSLEAKPDFELLIVDPIGSFLGGEVKSNLDNEVRSALMGIARLAREFEVAVLLVAHTRKDGSGSPDDLVMGSRAFTGFARSVLHVVKDADDNERRLLLVSKINNARRPPGWGFRVDGEPNRVRWEPLPCFVTVEEAYQRLRQGSVSVGRPAMRRADAGEFLRTQLRNASVSVEELRGRAGQEGHSWSTIDRAARELGVVRRTSGRVTWWALPQRQEGAQNA